MTDLGRVSRRDVVKTLSSIGVVNSGGFGSNHKLRNIQNYTGNTYLYFSSDKEDGGKKCYVVNIDNGEVVGSVEYPGLSQYSSPTYYGDKLIISSGWGNKLYAFSNVPSNQKEWVVDDVELSTHSSPTVVNNTVYIGVEEGVLSVDAGTGEKIWETTDHGRIPSSPNVVNDTVYVGSKDGMVYALDTQTGDEKWSFNTNSTFGDWASVTVYNGVVYAAPRTNQFYAIDAYDGTEVWSKSTLGETGTSPTIVDNTAFFGSSNDRIYALDVNDGQEKWTSELSTNAYTPTTVSDERLYIGLGSRVRALNKNTGEHLWDFSTDFFIRSTPTVYNGTVYFGSSNSMYAVNTTNGDKEWELETAGSVYSSPTVVTGSYSTDSRVLLGTLGHHDQWAEEARSSKPVADFTYAPRQPTAQGDIEFDASASQAPDSEIVQYEWDFSGDDTTDSTGEKTVFSFDEGSHQVTLTVRDDEGNVASTQEIVEVGPERINVSVTASDTEVEVNESTYVTYSVANFLTSDKIDVQLLVDTPSDVDVTSVRGADEGSNQFTATTTLPPSSQEEIRVTLTITGAGTHAISAIADYHVSGNPSNADRTVRSLTITADSTNGEGPSEKEAESSGVGVVSDRTPGFGISESIVALGGASYVMKKRIFDSGEKSD